MEKKIESEHLEKAVVSLLMQFHTVFDADWNYTKSYIEQLSSENTLLDDSLEGQNWQNRDQLVNEFKGLINHFKKNGAFKRAFVKEEDFDLGVAEFFEKYDI